MDPMESIKATFFQECEELLADLEAGLLAIQAGAGDEDTINAVFRAVHSVKGGAGAFGMDALVHFAHVFETLLDGVRAGRIAAAPDLLEILLRAADILADHVNAARDGGAVDEARSAEMIRDLEHATDPEHDHRAAPDLAAPDLAAAGAPGVDQPDEFGFTVTRFNPESLEPLVVTEALWKIWFRPKSALYRKGNESALLLRELARLGPTKVRLDQTELPDLASLDPESAFLAWEIELEADTDEAVIREVFEFVEGDCDIEIRRCSTSESPDATSESVITAIVEPPPSRATVNTESPASVKVETPKGEAVATPAHATIRVDPERIDRLIDLVGELVINQAMLAQRVIESGLPQSSNVATGLEDLESLTRQIQDSVMAIRAQPVKSVFQRMPRLVREVAAQTGKSVRLVTEGEATEVDKTVVERLGDPITHMIRNAIDHGLESPERRAAAGKPREGVVRLAALHRGGRIVIEVQDDGAGIDRKRVQAIAVEKGLIVADAQLTDEEVDNLIFLPGFSTANAISDISGRGVGMDVVRRSVQALGGRISITSRPGQGSTFTLSLPLTLAVLDGMVVDVAGHTLVVPLTAIVESLRPKPADVKRLGPQGAVLSVRDTYVPVVDVAAILGFRDYSKSPCDGVVILVESEDGGRAALTADSIYGQRQVVIKSLEANYRQVDGIAAATILGDGRVALIVDVDAVIAMRRRDTIRDYQQPLAAAG
ncbi:MAG: two-component system, chemotaxis family, sensor kinase CheA [Alphaproteobacteria bacterium]|nr:MAG: two-component system chemotaxis family sensor kinase CheA [Caulobacteraceae bacterium]TPW08774.1 MAG: two-component system, chemotaxis family, sensor kinase CheA [Alphaproteobacteria bacterium]